MHEWATTEAAVVERLREASRNGEPTDRQSRIPNNNTSNTKRAEIEVEKKKHEPNKERKIFSIEFVQLQCQRRSYVLVCVWVYLRCIHHNLNIIAINFGLLTLEFMFFPFPPFSHLSCRFWSALLFFVVVIRLCFALSRPVVESFPISFECVFISIDGRTK